MWPFKKGAPSESPTPINKLIVAPTGPRKLDPIIAAKSSLRRRQGRMENIHPPKRGMWVRLVHQNSQRTGILTDLSVDDVATVDVVDDHMGFTLETVHVPAAKLRQAYLEEIPPKRRPHESAGAQLGYVTKP